MKRWIADYRIESELLVSAQASKLVYRHPGEIYEAHVSNIQDGDHPSETLAVQIIAPAEDVESATELLDTYLEKFLHILSFVTGTGYRNSRQIFVMDWTPGATMRECHVFSSVPAGERFEALEPDLLETAGMLHTWGTTPAVERALRWYSSALRSSFVEDQFQYFWFVIEIIAVAKKSPAKVTDKCQKCNGNLVCGDCGRVSSHRPFEKQAIAQLLAKIGYDDQKIRDLFYIRNSLLHGEDRDTIEQHIQGRHPAFTFSLAVDALGQGAWAAIMNAFDKPPGRHQPRFLRPSTHVRHHLTMKAHLELGLGGDPGDPRIEDVHLPKITMELVPRPADEPTAKDSA